MALTPAPIIAAYTASHHTPQGTTAPRAAEAAAVAPCSHADHSFSELLVTTAPRDTSCRSLWS